MRRLYQDTRPFVDKEGFPQGTKVRPLDGRDEENGELLGTKVVYVRKRPKLHVSPMIQSFLSSNAPYRNNRDQRRFNGFRIQQFSSDRTWEGPHRRSGRLKSLDGPQLQTCVYLMGGTPVHSTRSPLDPYGPSLGVVRRHDFSVREAFRVPKDSLPKPTAEQHVRNPNTVCVNIWEEFIFGRSVISKKRKTSKSREHVRNDGDEGVVKYAHRVLGSFLPKFVIDFLTYMVYFSVFFFSCIGYNMFCELACYILLAQHLKIHEKAYEQHLDVMFTGSIFQGPLYAVTRSWCEHCCQLERAKVMRKLMRKMKADILPPTHKADASVNDASQSPS